MSIRMLWASVLACISAVPVGYSSTPSVESLLGAEYLELPPSLCKGYAEHFVGKVRKRDYVGLICEQEGQAYLLLQRLVRHTLQGKAVMKAVAIQRVPSLHPDELLLGRGCVAKGPESQAIFAIAQDLPADPVHVIKAWNINLKAERFEELDPATVSCSNYWLELEERFPE